MNRKETAVEVKHDLEKPITTWFDEDMARRLDRLAKRGDIPRSKLIRNLTEIGVEYLEACEKFGVLQTALVLRDLGKWVKGHCNEENLGDVERA